MCVRGQALGKVHQKMGDLRKAQEAIDEAIAIRRQLQSRDANKQMFAKELIADESKVKAVAERRKVIIGRLRHAEHAAFLGELSEKSEKKTGAAAMRKLARVATAEKNANAPAAEP